MSWREVSGKPDLRRTDIRFTTTDASGRQVTETFYMDQNLATGAYIIYKDSPIPFAGDVVVLQSNQEASSGLYKIALGPGSETSPPGIDTKQYQRLIATKLAEDADSKRADLYRKIGATPIATTLGVPGFRNVATPNPVTPTGSNPNPAQTPGGGGGDPLPGGDPPPEPLLPRDDINYNIPGSPESDNIDKKIKTNFASGIRYPEKTNPDQDNIKFTAKSITGRSGLKLSEVKAFSLGENNYDILGHVILPIQPSISDSNGVDWGGTSLNPIQAYAASASLQMIDSPAGITGGAAEALRQASIKFKEGLDQGFGKAISLYFAQEAVGAQNLLSRTSGAILNPNLELLFNGPTLRNFNFTFRLSPRSQSEARIVKQIIWFFKASMAVKRAQSQVFLKAPNVFDIQYLSGSDPHKSLNEIKTCALLGCDVDYTPDGTYMTFNDEGKTMTSYQLTLRFSELDPVYNTDYSDDTSIGY